MKMELHQHLQTNRKLMENKDRKNRDTNHHWDQHILMDYHKTGNMDSEPELPNRKLIKIKGAG